MKQPTAGRADLPHQAGIKTADISPSSGRDDAIFRLILGFSSRMLSFLRRARSQLRSALETKGPVHLFVGNEAADADSCISPVCAALVASAVQQRAHAVPTVAFVPVIPCRRADWPLRREASFLLAQGASTGTVLDDVAASLLYVDDEDVTAAIESSAALRLTLLDHNAAWGPFAATSGAVCEIIDHHCDRGAHTQVSGPARNISFVPDLGGVGSTCTLVARRLLDAAATGAIAHEAAAEAAHCLLGVILLDTINLEEAAGKTTPEDRDAVRDLCALLRGQKLAASSAAAAASAGPGDALDPEPASEDADARTTSALFATLRSLRMDPLWWLSLSVRQACWYDYKCFAYAASAGASASVIPASASGEAASSSAAQPAVQIGVSALTIHLSDFLAGTQAGSAATQTSAGSAAGGSGAGSSDAGAISVAAGRAAELRRFVSSSAPEGLAGTADAFMLMSYADGRRQLAMWTAPLKAAGVAAGDASGSSAARLTEGQIAWLAAQLEALPLLALRRILITDDHSHGDVSHSHDDVSLLLWEQGNTKASRKQVDPALAEIIARMPAEL